MPRKPDRILKALLVWTSVTTVIFWLPLVRCLFDGTSYQWAFSPGIGGRGLRGDLWFPALGSAYATAMLWLGWRGARRPFHWLLLAWHGFLAGGATYLTLSSPESFRFQGDTLGIDVSLAVAGPVLFGGFFLLAAVWSVRDPRRDRPRGVPAWTPANGRRLAMLLALLPVQFLLLRFGEPHGTTDAVGVLLTIGQWLALGWALAPRPAEGDPQSQA